MLPWAAKHYLTRNLWFLCCCGFFFLLWCLSVRQSNVEHHKWMTMVCLSLLEQNQATRPAMNHQVWRRRQRRRRKLNQWSLSAREEISLRVIHHNWVKDVISSNTNTIIITCTERWVLQTFSTISTRAWLHWKFNSHFVMCLKFSHQWASYMYCVMVTLSEDNFSRVRPGTTLYKYMRIYVIYMYQ